MMDDTVTKQLALISGGPHDGKFATGTWGCVILIKDALPEDPTYAVARSYYDAVYAADASLTWTFKRTAQMGFRPIVDRDGLPSSELYEGPTIW